MPWYTYECEKCGERVQQKASLAYRDVKPMHRGGSGCGGDGRLRRLQPAMGPAAESRRGHDGSRAGAAKDGSSGGVARAPEPLPAGGARLDPGAASPPPAAAGEASRAWEDRILDAVLSTMAEGIPGPRRLELVPRLLGMLPTLSLKLRFVEMVAARGDGADEAAALGDAVAVEVGAAPVEALAHERRLLELLVLAIEAAAADAGPRPVR